MKKQIREVRYFLFGQSFSDGVRITLAILVPSVLLAQFGYFQTGLPISMGALWVSIADSPGPLVHKRNGMLYGLLIIGLVTLITCFARLNIWLLGVEVAVFSFLLAMLNVYGNRAASVGTAALLAMILTMDRPIEPGEVWNYIALVVLGGLWYMAISLAAFQIRPYRAAQQALGECIHAIAKFLTIKARFYSVQTDLEDDYKALVAQQVVVSEKQDAVREILFKSRQIVQETTQTGRLLVLTFVDVVDLYEQIVAIYYDYAAIRERFAKTGVLDDIARLIKQMAVEMDYIGLAIQEHRSYKRKRDISRQLEELKKQIDAIRQEDGSNMVLLKLLVSLRNLNQRLNDILTYSQSGAKARRKKGELDYTRFVSHQIIDPQAIRNNLTLNSGSFRHALRMTLACLVGFVVSKVIDNGHHSYWILMTTMVLLKPGFSLTKQRNIERIIGTLAGGVIGVLLLASIPDKTALFWCMVPLMIGAYSFQRTNYILMVMLMTPYILILLTFLGIGGMSVVEERVLDTLIGSGIALAANYFLLPHWESEQLQSQLRDVLNANINYLQKLADGLAGCPVSPTDYRLARKEVYVSSANLSAAFQRMASEPQSKQRHRTEVHEFVVLNHILSANIATIASEVVASESQPGYSADTRRPVKRALSVLRESLRKLAPTYVKPTADGPPAEADGTARESLTADDQLLREQLDFIQKVSHDIGKMTDALLT